MEFENMTEKINELAKNIYNLQSFEDVDTMFNKLQKEYLSVDHYKYYVHDMIHHIYDGHRNKYLLYLWIQLANTELFTYTHNEFLFYFLFSTNYKYRITNANGTVTEAVISEGNYKEIVFENNEKLTVYDESDNALFEITYENNQDYIDYITLDLKQDNYIGLWLRYTLLTNFKFNIIDKQKILNGIIKNNIVTSYDDCTYHCLDDDTEDIYINDFSDNIVTYIKNDDLDNLVTTTLFRNIDITKYKCLTNITNALDDDVSSGPLSLIQIAEAYGAIKCFRYLFVNNCFTSFNDDAYYICYGKNEDILGMTIHKSDNVDFINLLKISIIFYRDDISDYCFENIVDIDKETACELINKALHFSNFYVIQCLEERYNHSIDLKFDIYLKQVIHYDDINNHNEELNMKVRQFMVVPVVINDRANNIVYLYHVRTVYNPEYLNYTFNYLKQSFHTDDYTITYVKTRLLEEYFNLPQLTHIKLNDVKNILQLLFNTTDVNKIFDDCAIAYEALGVETKYMFLFIKRLIRAFRIIHDFEVLTYFIESKYKQLICERFTARNVILTGLCYDDILTIIKFLHDNYKEYCTRLFNRTRKTILDNCLLDVQEVIINIESFNRLLEYVLDIGETKYSITTEVYMFKKTLNYLKQKSISIKVLTFMCEILKTIEKYNEEFHQQLNEALTELGNEEITQLVKNITNFYNSDTN